MDEFGERRPLWITEFGWPTHITPVVHDPRFLPQMIRYAASLRFSDRTGFPAAVLHEEGMPGCGAVGLSANKSLDAMPDVSSRTVRLQDLAGLGPATTQVLAMPTGEHYPGDYLDVMLGSVRGGGLLVHLGGVPFDYPRRLVHGEWKQEGMRGRHTHFHGRPCIPRLPRHEQHGAPSHPTSSGDE